jgi:hypothetical protein
MDIYIYTKHPPNNSHLQAPLSALPELFYSLAHAQVQMGLIQVPYIYTPIYNRERVYELQHLATWGLIWFDGLADLRF